jgi:hypothetical protein
MVFRAYGKTMGTRYRKGALEQPGRDRIQMRDGLYAPWGTQNIPFAVHAIGAEKDP